MRFMIGIFLLISSVSCVTASFETLKSDWKAHFQMQGGAVLKEWQENESDYMLLKKGYIVGKYISVKYDDKNLLRHLRSFSMQPVYLYDFNLRVCYANSTPLPCDVVANDKDMAALMQKY